MSQWKQNISVCPVSDDVTETPGNHNRFIPSVHIVHASLWSQSSVLQHSVMFI